MTTLLSILLSVIPPVPTRAEAVVETIHGVEVRDPYRWLENGDAPEVHGWTEQQNALMRKALDGVPGRKWLEERLWKLHEIGSLGVPVAKGKGKATRYFYTRRTGKQNQPVLYVRDGLDGPDRVLVDVNALKADGTMSAGLVGARPRTASWWPTGSAPTATRTRR
jgi:prolyl oligopeptidase